MLNKNELKNVRLKVSTDALNAWYNFNQKGTLQIATGVGKTRIGIRAIKWFLKNKTERNFSGKIVVITPREHLRDTHWANALKEAEISPNEVEIICIQTLYKRRNESYGLVIADEVHNYLSKEYIKFFTYNTVQRVIGLSAWIPYELRDLINSFAPICYTLNTDHAVALGLITPYIEYNIPVKVSKEYQALLDAVQQEYNSLEEKLGGKFEAFKNAEKVLKGCTELGFAALDTDSKKAVSLAKKFFNAIKERKTLLYECPEKIKVTNDILDKLNLEGSIIFSQTIKVADAIAKSRMGADCIAFHYESPKDNLKKFTNRQAPLKYLSTCKMVKEGLDLPELPAVIITSNNSKPKDHIQIRGRCLRLEDNKTSLIFNLYVPNSQDEKWLKSSQTFTEPGNIRWVSDVESLIKIEKERRERAPTNITSDNISE